MGHPLVSCPRRPRSKARPPPAQGCQDERHDERRERPLLQAVQRAGHRQRVEIAKYLRRKVLEKERHLDAPPAERRSAILRRVGVGNDDARRLVRYSPRAMAPNTTINAPATRATTHNAGQPTVIVKASGVLVGRGGNAGGRLIMSGCLSKWCANGRSRGAQRRSACMSNRMEIPALP